MGRPVMLREDSLHNRWVNSRALEILGIDDLSPDPVGGSYVRDAAGPVGLLLGQPSTDAELAARHSVGDSRNRDLRSAHTAVSIFNAAGITAVQDAATMGAWLDVFRELDGTGQLSAWLVGSLPAREFIESGPVGAALFDTAAARHSAHVRPDFVKAILERGADDAHGEAPRLLQADTFAARSRTPRRCCGSRAETMVTRRSVDPAFPGALAGRQALRRDAAIMAHTVNAARAAGLGEVTGKLAPGMSADFIIVDRNLFTVPVDQTHATEVRETWFAGRPVHDAAARR